MDIVYSIVVLLQASKSNQDIFQWYFIIESITKGCDYLASSNEVDISDTKYFMNDSVYDSKK